MSLLAFLIAWANSPFTVAAGIAGGFALLQATGLLGLLSGGGDHDGDVDGHDVDGEHDVDGHDADADHDADHDADAERGFGSALIAPLGFGKLPFSLIWQVYAVIFAVTGLALNARFFPAVPPVLTLSWTVPISLVSGYSAVATLARLLGPLFASKAQDATSRAELVGLMGVVISSQVTGEFGEVRIRDKTGHDVRVICKLSRGSRRAKEKESVVVVDYDAARGELFVAPLEGETDERLHLESQQAVLDDEDAAAGANAHKH